MCIDILSSRTALNFSEENRTNPFPEKQRRREMVFQVDRMMVSVVVMLAGCRDSFRNSIAEDIEI